MPDTPINPSLPDPPPGKKAKEHAEQDQQIANDITDAEELLEVAQSDPEIGPLMAVKGYDAAELQAGVTLQTAAQGAFDARQKAMAEADNASTTFNTAEQTARTAYADFRETARVKFAAVPDRTALGLAGAVPRDLQKFITTATASYVGAQATAYVATLTKAGYKPADIVALLAALKALAALHATFKTKEGNAKTATVTRDTAYRQMAKWVTDYRRLAKRALRGKPGLYAKIRG